MELLFLGTGTSVGVPMIGCDCPVCTSADPRNVRRRTSVCLTAGGTHIQVDTPPDFREQALTFGLRRIDAVLFTHAHFDHLFGFDDIRRFNTIQNRVMPVYAAPETLREVQRVFHYVGATAQTGLYRPLAAFHPVDGPFQVGAVRVTPVVVEHGDAHTIGFRFDWNGRSVGYVPDCHAMPDDAVAVLRGVDLMVLDALRYRPHPNHLAVDEAVALLGRIGAARAFLIHLCHDVDHATLAEQLPVGMHVSHDGLRVHV